MRGSNISIAALWRPTLAVVAPALVVLLALWFLDMLSGRTGLVAVVLIIVGTAFVVRLLLSDFAAICDHAEAVLEDTEARRPRLVFSDTLLQLLAAIRRVARTTAAMRQSASKRQETSGLDHLPDPVLMLDANSQVLRDNRAARELLGPGLVGRNIAAVLRNPTILNAVEGVTEGDDEIVDVEFSFQVPVERHFAARIARISDEASRSISVVIALHDVTAVKRIEQMRSDFVANASHELRTPISVLLGCLQTLRGSARDDPEAQAEFVGLMEGQADRMARLVEDLLQLSRIELNEHHVPSDRINLRSLVDQAVAALELKAEAQGMKIVVDFAHDIPEVTGDKDDLYRAIQNLLDNALKYGAEDSTVTVKAEIASEHQLAQLSRNLRYVALSVHDEGEGIAPEHLPRLTERFYRVDTARSRQLGGTGLGLAIVKHAVNRHRGALLVDSTVGEGSVFTIVLPIRSPAGGEDRRVAPGPERPAAKASPEPA